jgi:hypothetical protein
LRFSLGYGKDIMADLVFVNPFEETKIKSTSNPDISGMISPDSKLCVLIVKSYYNHLN